MFTVNLAALLKEKGLSKDKLAEKAGVSKMTVYRLCSGIAKGCEFETLYRIHKALGLYSIDELLPLILPDGDRWRTNAWVKWELETGIVYEKIEDPLDWMKLTMPPHNKATKAMFEEVRDWMLEQQKQEKLNND